MDVGFFHCPFQPGPVLTLFFPENPGIPLSVFMTFNRIKDLCNSVGDLETSVRESEELEVQEGPSSEEVMVRRRAPLVGQLDVDPQTVYLVSLSGFSLGVTKRKTSLSLCVFAQENYDAGFEHDAIRALLSPLFGEIAYISIPRNDRDRSPKGFCFVEFATPQLAHQFLAFLPKFHRGDLEALGQASKLSGADKKQLKKIKAISK